VFLNANPETTPLALRANVKHNHVLHECVLIVSLVTERVPYVAEAERLEIDDLGYRDDGITHLTARLGFQDSPNVPRLMELARDEGLERAIDVDHATYYLSSIVIVPGKRGGMVYWRKRIFMFLSRNAASPVEYFALPSERTVLIGSQIGL
jgi:KUP system potassium uptake protein